MPKAPSEQQLSDRHEQEAKTEQREVFRQLTGPYDFGQQLAEE